MPPCVGSGCRQTIVATGVAVERRRELADEAQAVGGRERERLAPRGQHAVRDDLGHRAPCGSASAAQWRGPRPRCVTGPRRPRAFQHAVCQCRRSLLAGGAVGRPGDDVRRAGPDLLVAARAAVGLRRARAGDPAHDPVAVGVLLDVLVRAAERPRLGVRGARRLRRATRRQAS